MTTTDGNPDSRLIELLRFPMMAAVVCIHCNLCPPCPWLERLPLFSSFTYAFIHIVCSIANPVFFFIAGFLFFKGGRFSLGVYRQKLRRRLRTLLVPYVAWTLVYLAIVAMLQTAKPGLQLLLHKPVGQLSATDFAGLFWNLQQVTHLPTDQAAPLVTQFWFLQCLMVCVLLSPLVWWGVKWLSVPFVAALGIIAMFDLLPDCPGLVWAAFFYFAMGAWFSVHNVSLTLFVKQWRYLFYGVLALSAAVAPLWPPALFLLNIGLLLTVFDVDSRLSERRLRMPQLLTSATFFIFAVHRLFTAVMTNLPRMGIVRLNTELSAFVYYFMAVTLSLALCVLCYYVMRRTVPRLTSLLSGGR